MGDVKVPNINTITVAGRLGGDPELKYTASGKAYCKFSVCHNRYWKDAQGNQVNEAHFFDVTCWDRMAEYIGERIKKGRPVLVEGELRQESWQDRESGQKRSKIGIQAQRVHVLDWDGEGQQGGGQRETRQQATAAAAPARTAPSAPRPQRQEELIPEEDIPF